VLAPRLQLPAAAPQCTFMPTSSFLLMHPVWPCMQLSREKMCFFGGGPQCAYDVQNFQTKGSLPVKGLPCVIFWKAGAPRPDEVVHGLSTRQAVIIALAH
jgi:hypothetical protein